MKYIIVLLCMLVVTRMQAQEKITLYAGGIPNSIPNDGGYNNEDMPELFVYEPTSIKAKKAILVIPGGGYGMVAIDHEGHQVAQALVKEGYAAFVLKYRLPKVTTMKDKRYGPLQDAQQALSVIRQYKNYDQVGVLGFSAGGHLAATLANLYKEPQIKTSVSLKPDFSILLYPVISMDDALTHNGSKTNLIGPAITAADELHFSMEKQVTKNTPPTFLMHAKDDKSVPIANSLVYQEALKKVGVKSLLFTYETGGHGFGLVNKTDAASWFDSLMDWLAK